MQDEKNHVFTEIEINATPEQVWNVLTDWDKLKEWSSTFIGISTDSIAKGKQFISYYKNPITGKAMELHHICTEYEEVKKFGWSGDILIDRIRDHHIFSLEPTPKGTTIFKQEDGLHGPHSKLLNFLAEHQMTSMYLKFN
jgi:hypothetical protein